MHLQMKELGYGDEYKYSHDYANNFAEQEFLPKRLVTKRYIPEIILAKSNQRTFKPFRQIRLLTTKGFKNTMLIVFFKPSSIYCHLKRLVT
jgi:putative ATPase